MSITPAENGKTCKTYCLHLEERNGEREHNYDYLIYAHNKKDAWQIARNYASGFYGDCKKSDLGKDCWETRDGSVVIQIDTLVKMSEEDYVRKYFNWSCVLNPHGAPMPLFVKRKPEEAAIKGKTYRMSMVESDNSERSNYYDYLIYANNKKEAWKHARKFAANFFDEDVKKDGKDRWVFFNEVAVEIHSLKPMTEKDFIGMLLTQQTINRTIPTTSERICA